MVCRCPAFYEYRVLALKQLKETVIHDSSDSVWDCHLTNWSVILRILVCPDFIQCILPDFNIDISRIEQISREFFYKMSCQETSTAKKGMMAALIDPVYSKTILVISVVF